MAVKLDSIGVLQTNWCSGGGWLIKHPYAMAWVYSEADAAFVPMYVSLSPLTINPKALQFPTEIEAIAYGRKHLLRKQVSEWK